VIADTHSGLKGWRCNQPGTYPGFFFDKTAGDTITAFKIKHLQKAFTRGARFALHGRAIDKAVKCEAKVPQSAYRCRIARAEFAMAGNP
jgi:hypothetical protein